MKLLMLILSIFSLNTYAQFSTEDTSTINIMGGNTDLKTYAFKSQNIYKWTKHSLGLNGIYNYGESNKKRSAENWNAGLKYNFLYSKKMSLYLGELIEANRFSGIRRRYNSDIGAKYIFVDNDRTKLFTELGYRYTIEKSTDRSASDLKDSKGRIYIETSRVFKKDLSGRFWIEALPNFSNPDDYLINLEPSLITTLTSTFSMKSAYLWKYDNSPNTGKGKHNYKYTLSLIAKF